MMAMARSDARVVNGVELVLWPSPMAIMMYGVTDQDDVAWMQPKLTPHPWKCFAQPLRLQNSEAFKRLRQTNINCTQSLKASAGAALERQLTADRLFEIDTGHDLMITEPDAVSEMLMRPF